MCVCIMYIYIYYIYIYVSQSYHLIPHCEAVSHLIVLKRIGEKQC